MRKTPIQRYLEENRTSLRLPRLPLVAAMEVDRLTHLIWYIHQTFLPERQENWTENTRFSAYQLGKLYKKYLLEIHPEALKAYNIKPTLGMGELGGLLVSLRRLDLLRYAEEQLTQKRYTYVPNRNKLIRISFTEYEEGIKSKLGIIVSEPEPEPEPEIIHPVVSGLKSRVSVQKVILLDGEPATVESLYDAIQGE